MQAALEAKPMERAWIFSGVPEQVSEARAKVRFFLGRCPASDDAVLVISELATNATLHSLSRNGTYAVRVTLAETYVHLEVEDAGGPWVPAQADIRLHGLGIVSALAREWGIISNGHGRTVWARVDI